MIITGGQNVYLSEVQSILSKCELIKEAYVFGVNDKYWGSKICVLLSWKTKKVLDLIQLKKYCKTYLPHYKCPKHFYVTEKFPMTASGKIMYNAVIENLHNGFYEEIIK